MKQKLICVVMFFGVLGILQAQPSLLKLQTNLSKESKGDNYQLTLTGNTQASLNFPEQSRLLSTELQGWLNAKMEFRNGVDEMISPKKPEPYLNNISIQKYHQYYNGIPVEHGSIKVTAIGNKVASMQMEFYSIDANIKTTPVLSQDEALQKAMQFVGAKKYVWDGYNGTNPELQKPVGTLVVVQDYFNKIGTLHLAYKFKIAADEPLSKSWIYVDAIDGSVLLVDRILKHLNPDFNNTASKNSTAKFRTDIKPLPSNANGTADTRYSGTQPIITDFNGTNYTLKQTRNGHSIITLNYQRLVQNSTNDSKAVDFIDNDNNWTTGEHANNYDDAALDVQFAMQFISDYWKNIHGRNSWNNAFGEMRSYVHIRATANAGYDNAYWDGFAMYYGDGSYYSTNGNGSINNSSGFKPLTSLDVSAHELGHAVCQNTANLVYQRESGAMNEGFSDIWAACVENYSGLPKSVWLIGEEIYPSAGALRSMQNPKLFSNPDTYGGQYWIKVTLAGCAQPGSSTNDNCGVHYNSGVLNKWFFLITQGENGINDNGDSYKVTGLGFSKSEKIAFLTELNLTQNADYAAARTAAINAATTLYGACSNEVIQVTNAWFAVGVGATANCSPVVEFIKTKTSVTEGTGLSGNCASTKTLNIPIKLGKVATQKTDINFTLGGTATNGLDYNIPSTTVSFNAGESGIKNLSIVIYDDATNEGNETIILSYTINANGGNGAAGSNNQIHTITITDDDVPPFPISATAVSYPVLVNEHFETSSPGTTFPTGWESALVFSGAGSVNKWAIGSNGGAGITGNAAYITNDISLANPPFAYSTSSATDRLLRLPVVNTTGLTNLQISFKYKVDGEYYLNNALYDYGRILYDVSGTGTTFSTLIEPVSTDAYALYGNGSTANNFGPFILPSSLENLPAAYIGFRWTNNNNFAGSSIPLLIDDVLVTARTAGSAIETQAGQTGTANIIGGIGSSYLTSAADSQIIAKITNINQNIPCVTAQVLEGGTLMVPINLTGTSYFRTSKVIKLTPATPNTTASYQGTLYFTTNELSAWGTDNVNLKILKVKDGVNLSGLIDASNATLITPTSVTLDETNGTIAYTGSFVGFSQFMLVSPTAALPINLISFTANSNKKGILLKWSTALEFNNKGFNIERSDDGITFNKIGWQAGKGNTNSGTKYEYLDRNILSNQYYFYRLVQQDYDNKESISVIRKARLDNTGLLISISPNPANGVINIAVSQAMPNAIINLINGTGQTVKTWKQVTIDATNKSLNVAGIAAGVYSLQIISGNNSRVEKIIIKN